MNTPLMLAVFFFGLCGFALLVCMARRASLVVGNKSIEALLCELEPLDIGGLSCVANDFLEPTRGQVSIEPEVIWHMVGGESGLQRMRRNADVLLALAAIASEWNDEEGAIVTERMRFDAVRLRSAVRQVRLGMALQVVTGSHAISVPFRLQEAASSYYLMRQRLLALFETSNIALLPALSQAL